MATHTPPALMGSQISLTASHRLLSRSRATPLTAAPVWRRGLTWMLGLIWLLDAGLQFQPYMFTKAFPQQVIGSTANGNPWWVHDPVIWASTLMANHIVLLNGAFATAQLLIAVGLFWPRTVKFALGASIAWSVLVWWLGEGLGGILTGPVSPVAGLPGAVLLYAIAAALLWPRDPYRSTEPTNKSIAARSPLRATGATVVWIALWGGLAAESLIPANRSPAALHDMVAGMADGEPTWIGHINTWAAGLLDGRALGVSIFLAVCFALISLSAIVPSLTRAGVILAVITSLAIWVIFQDFGGIGTGQGTDPNSGLPLALLALCYWPVFYGKGRKAAPAAS